jgi:glucans biosynthesis protein C
MIALGANTWLEQGELVSGCLLFLLVAVQYVVVLGWRSHHSQRRHQEDVENNNCEDQETKMEGTTTNKENPPKPAYTPHPTTSTAGKQEKDAAAGHDKKSSAAQTRILSNSGKDTDNCTSSSTTTTLANIVRCNKNRDIETQEDDGDLSLSVSRTHLSDDNLQRNNTDDDDNSKKPSCNKLESTSISQRLPYLDNVKSFLTALVVTFHVSCAFGGCGDRLWFLILGFDDPSVPPWFRRVNDTLTVLCQSFFMPLFFLIAACFVPRSYRKQGSELFLTGKRRRLGIPLLVLTFGLVPACFALAQVVAGNTEIRYVPMPAHGWFLLWLLLFNYIYHSYCKYTKNNRNINHSNRFDDASRDKEDIVTRNWLFPKTWERWVCGATICGILMLGCCVLGKTTIATMPASVGSLACDLVMFWIGIQAQKHGWLDESHFSSIREQMDISPGTLWCFVVVEVAAIAYLRPYVKDHIVIPIVFFPVAGVYCLDISLAILDFFQHHLHFENKVTLFFSEAAYGVFFIHPAVVVGMTSLYVWGFNEIVAVEDCLLMTDGPLYGLPPLSQGGGDYSHIGWLLVVVTSHLVVWPTAYLLKQLPILKDII